VLVEYDADAGNRWVPHPVSAQRWLALASQAGLSDTRIIGRVPSRFLDSIYAAVSLRTSARPPSRAAVDASQAGVVTAEPVDRAGLGPSGGQSATVAGAPTAERGTVPRSQRQRGWHHDVGREGRPLQPWMRRLAEVPRDCWLMTVPVSGS
jgi:hypothetical protein